MQTYDSEQNLSLDPSDARPIFLAMLVTQEISGICIPSEFQQAIRLLAHNTPYELLGYFTGVVENGIFYAADNSYIGRSNINHLITTSAEQIDPITRWKDDFKLICARRAVPNLQTLVWHSRPFMELGPLLSFTDKSEDIINEHYSKVKAGSFRDMFDADREGLFVNSNLKDAIAFFNNRRMLSRVNLPSDIFSDPCDTFMDLAKICGFTTEGSGAINISDINLMEKAINHTQRVPSQDDIETVAGPQVIVRPWPGSQENCEILPYGKPNPFKNGTPDIIRLTEDRLFKKTQHESLEDKLESAKQDAAQAAKIMFGPSSGIDSLIRASFTRTVSDSRSGFLSQKIFLQFENCPVLNDWVETVKGYTLN